jgi:hypothetical protein
MPGSMHVVCRCLPYKHWGASAHSAAFVLYAGGRAAISFLLFMVSLCARALQVRSSDQGPGEAVRLTACSRLCPDQEQDVSCSFDSSPPSTCRERE